MSTTTVNFDLIGRDYASSAFNRVSGSAAHTESTVKKLTLGVGTLVKSFAGFYAVTKAVQFFGDAFDQAQESIKATGQTQAVIKSTGGAANVTAQEVGKLANALSLKTGVDDEVIQSGENVLLTFRNIRNEAGKGNDIFTQATKLTQDLSVSLGKSLNSSAIMVGKALNDPVLGITALSRAGVQFTQHQKDVITSLVESGDTLKAQKMILGELSAEFQGSAKAQATAADKAKVAWQNLQEKVGKALMPVLNDLLRWFTKDIVPALSAFVGFMRTNVGPVFDAIKGFFSGDGMDGSKLQGGFQKVVQGAVDIYNAFKPVVIDLVNAVKQNWPEIQRTIGQVLAAVGTTISAFAQLVTALWKRFGSTILRATGVVFRNIGDVVRTGLQILTKIVQIFTDLLNGNWKDALHKSAEIVIMVFGPGGLIQRLLGRALGFIGDSLKRLGEVILEKVRSAWSGALDATVTWIGKMVAKVKALPGNAKDALGDLTTKLLQAGKDLIQGFINGITSKLGEVKSAASGVAGGAIDSIKGALGIHSPSKVFYKFGEDTVQGFIDGVNSKISSIKQAMSSMTSTIKGAFDDPFSQGSTITDVFTASKAALHEATQFRNDLRKLDSMGVSPAVISGLVNSGNFALIHALAGANKHQIQRLNHITAATNRMQNQGANLAANDVYGDRLSEAQRQKDRILQAKANADALEQKTFHLKDAQGRRLQLMIRGG